MRSTGKKKSNQIYAREPLQFERAKLVLTFYRRGPVLLVYVCWRWGEERQMEQTYVSRMNRGSSFRGEGADLLALEFF